MLAVAIPIGLLIGLSLGALGGGGSILTVPALVYLLDQSPHAGTTGSLLIVGITALAGTAEHWHDGHVHVGQGVTFAVLGLGGSYVGTRLSASVDPDLLLAGFAALLLAAAAAMLHGLRRADPGAGAGPTSRARPTGSSRLGRGLTVVAAATVVGLLTGFFGVGGGFLIVPALVLVLGFDMPVAVGTSLLVIAINCAAALTARIGTHTQLDWPLLAVFTAAAVAGSFVGNRVSTEVAPARLVAAFAALLVVVAGYTAVRSVPQLI